MQSKIFSAIKYLFTLVIATALLWYAFKDISFKEMFNKLGEVKFGWVYLSIFLSVFSHVLRAYRWNILLRPLNYHVELSRSFWAVMVGYLANLAFPRMGEVTKCGVLKKTDGVKMSASMGTVVTERIFDVLSLLLIMGLTFLIEFNRLSEFFINLYSSKVPGNASINIGLLIAVGIIALLGIALIALFWKKISSTSLYQNAFNLMMQFKDGLLSIRRIDNIPGFILSSLGIWFLYYLMSYIIVFSIPETSDLNWIAGMAILVVGGIAMSAPVQGGIGTYHVLVAALLTLYGIEQSTGVFFATLLHTSQTLSVMFFGGLSLVIITFINKRKLQVNETT
ncbi:MAG: lysylphosphatidylglycerol synthase transmembrane domain-containing protein [Cyclobacteriaceae bacterium]